MIETGDDLEVRLPCAGVALERLAARAASLEDVFVWRWRDDRPGGVRAAAHLAQPAPHYARPRAPLAMAAWLVTGTGAQDASDWGTIAALQLLLMLLTTVYTMATPTVAARRQGLVLERLRSAGLSHRESLGGLLAPIFAVALVLLVAAVPAGATAPAAPEGPALAVGLGALLCAGAAPATTRWTPGAELAQLTTAPFRFGRVAGAAGALDTHSHHARALLTPGGAVAALGLEAWATPGRCAVLPAALAGRGVTWEPRR